MKNVFRTLLIVTALSAVLLGNAFASKYDDAAQELKTAGLFQGTNEGFELDRAPTRTEAAVMLVRLLGAEEQAKAQYEDGTVSDNFQDVYDWADPYIAWLYSNGLIKGLSDTAFGSGGQCTAKMYCTFVLRALGYSDTDGDFSFDGADDFAEQIGIYDSSLVGDTFLRDNAVAVSYQALASYMKGTSATLLDKLVSEGSVSRTDAAALISKVGKYRACLDAEDKIDQETALSITHDRSISAKCAEDKTNINVEYITSMKAVSTDDDFQMEIISTTDNEGNIDKTCYWLKDGYVYIKSGSTRIKEPLASSSLYDLLTSSTGMPLISLYDFSSVTSASTYNGTCYTFTYTDNYNFLGDLDTGLDISDFTGLSADQKTFQITVGYDGKLSSYKENLAFSVTEEDDDENLTYDFVYTLDSEVNATGSAVSITFPDFSDYIEY